MTSCGYKLTAAIALCSSFYACKKPKLEAGRTAYIVGASNDIETVGSDNRDAVDPDVLRSAVLIVTRTDGDKIKFCSGTLIEPELPGENLRVLSNHHCFAMTGENELASEMLMPGACTSTKVYLGFLPGETSNAAINKCAPGSLRTNFSGDLSVFTLAEEVSANYKPASLYDGPDQGIGRRALIVHYPNIEENLEAPADGKVELPTAALTLNDCQVLGEFDPIEWSLDRSLPISLRHTCDLIHGSSGSGLIDAETGKILGVNWGGIKVSYSDHQRIDNVATKAKFVEAFLANRADEEIAAVEARREEAAGKKNASAGGIERRTRALFGSQKSGQCGVILGTKGQSYHVLNCLSLLVVPFFIATAQWYTSRRRRY